MKFLKKIKRLFKRKIKFKALATGEVAIEAFRHDGIVYYHFEDSSKIPAGRALCALAIYEELRMRCTADYLAKHIRATEILLNPQDRQIKLNELAIINNNLKERLNLAPFPDHIYKLASVTFFDETENPFAYDFIYNQKKIERWKKDPDILYFFLSTQLKDLMPFGATSKEHVQNYLTISEQIDKIHQSKLRDILSRKS